MARRTQYEQVSVYVPPPLADFLDSVAVMSGLPRNRIGGYLLLVGCAGQARSDGDEALAAQLTDWAKELFRRGDLPA